MKLRSEHKICSRFLFCNSWASLTFSANRNMFSSIHRVVVILKTIFFRDLLRSTMQAVPLADSDGISLSEN